MTTWEYLRITVSVGQRPPTKLSEPWRQFYDSSDLPEDPDLLLDCMGQHGWELVSVDHSRRDQRIAGNTVYGIATVEVFTFKRPGGSPERDQAIALMSEDLDRRRSDKRAAMKDGPLDNEPVECPTCGHETFVTGAGAFVCRCGETVLLGQAPRP